MAYKISDDDAFNSLRVLYVLDHSKRENKAFTHCIRKDKTMDWTYLERRERESLVKEVIEGRTKGKRGKHLILMQDDIIAYETKKDKA